MTDCEKAAELLSARLDGPLSREEEKKLEAHLAQCPPCRVLAGDLAQLHEILPQMTQPLPQGLHQTILDRVRVEQGGAAPERTRRAGSARRRWAALAAVLALVALGTWGALRAAVLPGGGEASGAALMAPAAEPDLTGQADASTELDDVPAAGGTCVPSPAPDAGTSVRTPEAKASAPSAGSGTQTPDGEKASPKSSPPEPSATPDAPLRGETDTAAQKQQAEPESAPEDTSAPDQNVMLLAPEPFDSAPASAPAPLTEEEARAALEARLDETGVRGELTALGLSSNGEYYQFSLAGADGGEENRYAVALDGGTVVPLFLVGDDGTPADNEASYRQAVGEN